MAAGDKLLLDTASGDFLLLDTSSGDVLLLEAEAGGGGATNKLTTTQSIDRGVGQLRAARLGGVLQ